MAVTITITAETVTEAQQDMRQLLTGISSISDAKASPRAAPTVEAQSTVATSVTPQHQKNGEQTANEPQNSESAATPNEPKRGRGRPRKTDTAATDTPPTTEDAATQSDEGNESTGEPSAPEAEQPLEDASSTSSETATVSSEPEAEAAGLAPVTDTELQRFCARLAQHYGSPQKVFDLCKPFLEEGEFARPTNIKGDAKRWDFIRLAEMDAGVTYHG